MTNLGSVIPELQLAELSINAVLRKPLRRSLLLEELLLNRRIH